LQQLVEARDISDLSVLGPQASGIPLVSFCTLAFVKKVPRLDVAWLTSDSRTRSSEGDTLRHVPVPFKDVHKERRLKARDSSSKDYVKLVNRLRADQEDWEAVKDLTETFRESPESSIVEVLASLETSLAAGAPMLLASRILESLVASDTAVSKAQVVRLLEESKDQAFLQAVIGALFHAQSADTELVTLVESFTKRHPSNNVAHRSALALGHLLSVTDHSLDRSAIAMDLVTWGCSHATESRHRCTTVLYAAGNCGDKCEVHDLLVRHAGLAKRDSIEAEEIAVAAMFALRSHSHKESVQRHLVSVLSNHEAPESVKEAAVECVRHGSLSRRKDIMDKLHEAIEHDFRRRPMKAGYEYLQKRATWSDSSSTMDNLGLSTGSRSGDVQTYPQVCFVPVEALLASIDSNGSF